VYPRVSAAFENRDITEAIAAIVKPYDHALVLGKKRRKNPLPSALEIQGIPVGKKEMIQDLIPPPFPLPGTRKDGNVGLSKMSFLLKGKVRPQTLKIISKWSLDPVIGPKMKALGIYKVSVPPDSDIPAIVSRINALPVLMFKRNRIMPTRSPLTARICLCRPVRWPKRSDRWQVPVGRLDSGLTTGTGPDGFVIASLDAVISRPAHL